MTDNQAQLPRGQDGRDRRSLSPNPLDPELMTADQRLQEVISLLSAGFLRHWLRKAADGTENALAIPGEPSDSCLKPKSAGERHE